MQCVATLLCPAASVEGTVSPRYRTAADRLCVVGEDVTVCQGGGGRGRKSVSVPGGGGGGDMNVLEWGGRSVGFVGGRSVVV